MRHLKRCALISAIALILVCSVVLLVHSPSPSSGKLLLTASFRGSREHSSQQQLHNRKYSSFSCSLSFSDSHSSPQSWLARSCELRGLCFDGNISRSWLSLAPDSTYALPGISERPNLTVSLSPASSVWKGSPGTPWAPQVKLKEIPAKDVTWAGGTHFFYSSYNAENPGHFMFEELYGWWLLMHTFGLSAELRHDLATAWRFPTARPWTCDERLEKGDLAGVERCHRIARKFTPTLLSHTAINADRVRADRFPWSRTHLQRRPADAPASTRTVCFERVLVGLGFNTDHCQDESEHGINLQAQPLCNAGRAGLLREFAGDILAKHGIQHPGKWLLHPGAHTCVRELGFWQTAFANSALAGGVMPKVVFAEQSSENRFFVDQHSIREALANWLPAESFVAANLAKMDVAEQLQLMSQTAVFITTCGGGSVVNIFMPPGSTLVIICNWNTRRDWHIYNFMAERNVRWVDTGMSSSIEVHIPSLQQLVQQGLDSFQCAKL